MKIKILILILFASCSKANRCPQLENATIVPYNANTAVIMVTGYGGYISFFKGNGFTVSPHDAVKAKLKDTCQLKVEFETFIKNAQ